MAKHGRKKTATFTLEPDGFSIHTFEVSRQIEGKRYHKIKDYLYALNTEYGKIVTYQESKRIIKCTAFRAHGINITLENNAGKDGSYQAMTLRIFISPRRLLDPDTSYLGILPPRKKSIDDVFDAFDKLFANTPLPADLNDYILTRVDLCTNIRCDKTKLFRELVRVIHKLPTPPKYERKIHKNVTKGMSDAQKNTTRKEDSKYNKHYFKVACDSMALVIYDKTYQMSAEGLSKIAYEDYDYKTVRDKHAFTQEQYDIVYSAAKEAENGLPLMLMLETGVSRSELLGLRWDDIDTEGRSICITQGLVVYHDADADKQVLSSDGLKNKFRKRIVPITDEDLWTRLSQAPRTVKVGKREISTEYVIHSPEGKPYNPNNWANRVYYPFMRKLNAEHPDIPILSPHELRHTRATLWIAQGIDPYMVARLLGHSDLKMLTKIYDHTSPETLRSALLEVREEN